MPASRQEIDEQAAEWMICLYEGPLSDEQRQAFERWKQQGPQYAAAAARMQDVVSRMHSLRGQQAPAQAALSAAFNGQRPPRSGKRAARALLLTGCLALPVALMLDSRFAQQWLADSRTGPTEWKTLHLADQSTLTLSGGSALNVHFDGQQRRIELLQGEILVDVAHDATRPFIVQTEQGSLRALGTRFVVRREADSTVLTLLQSRVAAQSANAQQTLEVATGEQARIRTASVQLLGTVDPQSIDEAWRRHQLVVENRPLSEVLDELDRHRRGHLQFDREALAGLRVSAVLPLDDTDRALELMAQSLPIEVQHFTPWLTRVTAAPTAKK